MILLYHGIESQVGGDDRWYSRFAMSQLAFKKQISWLLRKFKIVSLSEYLERSHERSSLREVIAITFDDGFRSTYQCIAPFLKSSRVPVTFFVSTGHLEHGELLWFSYLKALCLEKIYPHLDLDQTDFNLQTCEQGRQALSTLTEMAKKSGNPVLFTQDLSRKYPLPAAIKEKYEGMTYQQIKDAVKSGIFELAAHSVTHPYLNLLSRDKQSREINQCKSDLSAATGRPVCYFAYPGGEYDQASIDLVRASQYAAAFSIIPRGLGDEFPFEIGRVGIYSPSLWKLKIKTTSLLTLARKMGARVG